MSSVQLRCVIERSTDMQSSQAADSTTAEVDRVAAVPSSLPFYDLPQFMLITFGYSTADSLASRLFVEVRNWKPIPIDNITDDFTATVEQILGSLASYITIRIRLTRTSKFRVVDDVKQKMLVFLLHNARDLLVTAGCPINKSELDALVHDRICPNVSSLTSLSDDVKRTFDCWYSDQMKSSCHTDSTHNVDKDDTHHSSPAARLSNGHTVRSMAGHNGSRTWFDPMSEIPLLQHWLSVNSHPSRADMLCYTRELNDAPHRRALQRPLDVNNVAYWFKNARARAIRRRSSPSPLNASHVDDTHTAGIHIDSRPSDNGGRVPELPSSNAVYLVSPVHDVTDGATVSRKRRRRSIESDENHNERCTSSLSSSSSLASSDLVMHNPLDDDNSKATDLSLHVRTRSTSSLSDDDVTQRCNDHIQHAGPLVTNTLHPALQPSTTTTPLSLSLHVQQALHQQMQLAMRYMQHPLYTAGSPAGQHWLPWLKSDQDDDSSTTGSTAGGTMTETLCEVRRKRSRVFIDPLTEIPRLEQWFAIDSHPSSTAIERLTDELNRSAYRQRFPPLEPKNVQLWFKNHRAKVKRQSVEGLAPTSHQLMNDVKDDVKLAASVTVTSDCQ